MRPRVIAVTLSGLGEGLLTVTSPRGFSLRYGTPPKRRERFFAADERKLEDFTNGRASLQVMLDGGKMVTVRSFIRGN